MLLFFSLIFIATVFFPGSVIIILIINLAAGMVLSIAQMVAAFFPHYAPSRNKISDGRNPFVSIIIPAYNEPPAMLMQTLEALSLLRYSRFEVLLIDNNTKNPLVWKPIENFVKTVLTKRFAVND